jgi:hypothetical protein
MFSDNDSGFVPLRLRTDGKEVSVYTGYTFSSVTVSSLGLKDVVWRMRLTLMCCSRCFASHIYSQVVCTHKFTVDLLIQRILAQLAQKLYLVFLRKLPEPAQAPINLQLTSQKRCLVCGVHHNV